MEDPEGRSRGTMSFASVGDYLNVVQAVPVGGQVGVMGTIKPVQVVCTSEFGGVTTLPCALLDIWPLRTLRRWVWPLVGRILAGRCRECMNFAHLVTAG